MSPDALGWAGFALTCLLALLALALCAGCHASPEPEDRDPPIDAGKSLEERRIELQSRCDDTAGDASDCPSHKGMLVPRGTFLVRCICDPRL